MEEHCPVFAFFDNNRPAAMGPEVTTCQNDIGLTGQFGGLGIVNDH